MRLAARLACAIAAVATAAAQTPARDANQFLAPSGTGVIAGVVRGADDKPMRQVVVRLEGDPRAARSAVTDETGRFAFTAVPDGTFTVRATKPGFPDTLYGARRPGRPGLPLNVTHGSRFDTLVVVMERGVVLAGHVYDDRGVPMAGASVVAYRAYTALDGSFTLSAVNPDRPVYPETDDRGAYRFFGLPAGEYIVGTSPFFFGMGSPARVPSDADIRDAFARASQLATTPVGDRPASPPSPPVNFAAMFFPQTFSALDAARIRLAPGEAREDLDLHLAMKPMAHLTGSVTAPGLAPTSLDAELIQHPSTGGGGLGTVTSVSPDGKFAFQNLAPAEYTLTISNDAAPRMFATQSFTIDGRDIDGVALTLEPAMTMRGAVVLDAASQGATLPPFSVALSSIALGGPAAFARPGADGRFVLEGVIPGRYRVTLTPAGPGAASVAQAWSTLSTSLGDADVTDLVFDISRGQTLPPLTVTMTNQLTELSGVITQRDGTPDAGIFVIAVAADQRYWIRGTRRIKAVRTDGAGKYVFTGLAPGDYRIAATLDMEPSDLQDRSFIQQIVGASVPITLSAGEKKVVNLGGGT